MSQKYKEILAYCFLLCAVTLGCVLCWAAGYNTGKEVRLETTVTTIPVEISAETCLKVPSADDGDIIAKPGHTIDYSGDTWYFDGVVVATSVPAEDSAFEACGSPEIINAITIG